jgi:FkbM family methyltransferase
MGRVALPDLLRQVRSNVLVNRGLRATLGAKPWREQLPSSIWRRVPIFGDFTVELPDAPSFVYEGNGEPLGKTLFWRGIQGFEPGSADVFMALARQASLLFDVGAYSGYYTLLGLSVSPRLRARCFEPVPMLRAWALRQLERNHFEQRADVVAAAVTTSGGGHVSFFVMNNPHAPSSSLHRDYGGEQRSEVRVAATTLDAQAAACGTRVDLIKVDAEGAEDAVLASGEQVLREHRPFVLCEILEGDSRHLENLESLLKRHAYRFAHVKPDGVTMTPRLDPDPTRRLRNFLLFPGERSLPAEIRVLSS